MDEKRKSNLRLLISELTDSLNDSGKARKREVIELIGELHHMIESDGSPHLLSQWFVRLLLELDNKTESVIWYVADVNAALADAFSPRRQRGDTERRSHAQAVEHIHAIIDHRSRAVTRRYIENMKDAGAYDEHCQAYNEAQEESLRQMAADEAAENDDLA